MHGRNLRGYAIDQIGLDVLTFGRQKSVAELDVGLEFSGHSDDCLPFKWLFSFRVYRGGNDNHGAISLKAEKFVFRMKVVNNVNSCHTAIAKHSFACGDHALRPLVEAAGSVVPAVAPKRLAFVVVALASCHALLCSVVSNRYAREEKCRSQTVLVASMVWIRQQPSCLVVVLDKIAKSAHVCERSRIFLIPANTVAVNASKLEDNSAHVL